LALNLCGVVGDGTITWVKPLTGRVPYAKLPPCSKFALNSCRNTNGVKDEQGCATNKQPAGWDSYRGLMYTAGCNSDQCLCKGGNFLLHWNYLVLAGSEFCNYLPTTSDYNSTEYDDLQGAFSSFCKERGYPPLTYLSYIIGDEGSSLDLNSSAPGMHFSTHLVRPLSPNTRPRPLRIPAY